MRLLNINRKIVALSLSACLLCWGVVLAKGKPGGGGGGGGGGSTLNYQIVYLDDLDGFLSTTAAYDVNRYRDVVGQAVVSDPDTGTHGYAAYWSVVDGSSGVQTTAYCLPSTGYGDVWATGINDNSEIVGRGYAELGYLGIYWPIPNVEPLVLTPLQGDNESGAEKINAGGIVCGYSSRTVVNPDGSETRVTTPVVWQAYLAEGLTPAVTNPVALPVPNGLAPFINAINDLDEDGICQIVGSGRNTQQQVPLRWTVASTESGLVVAPTAEQLDAEGAAYGINNRSDVCGTGPAPDQWGATVWSGPNKYTLKRARDIGVSFGRDINDAGVVVGEGAYIKRGVFRYYLAAVWTSPQSEMILLDTFIPNGSPFTNIVGASAVNQAGDIVGQGWTGDYKAYLAIRR